MGFNLSNWFLRKKIDAKVRNSGRPMEHSRVVNPYHAVSLEPGPRACAEVRKVEGRRFLTSDPPMLPLHGCDSKTCQCRYVHHSDRRRLRDRRVNFANPHAHSMTDRRTAGGRRSNDMS